METFKLRHAFCLIALYMLGSNIIYLGNTGYHAWQGILVTFIIYIPIFFVWGYLMAKNPGKNLFEIIRSCFAFPIAKIVIFLYILFALFLAGKIMFNYHNFVVSTALMANNAILVLLSTAVIVIYILKLPLSIIARFVQTAFVIVVFVTIFFFLISLGEMRYEYILPIIPYHSTDFLNNVLYFINSPFGETIMLMNLLCNCQNSPKKSKIFFLATALTTLVMSISIMRTVAVLGDNLILHCNYPLYSAAGVVNIADFLARIESFSIIVFFLTAIIKLIVCGYSINAGLKELINCDTKNRLIIPIVLSFTILGQVLYTNVTEMFSFNRLAITAFYSIILPIIMFIITFCKNKKIYTKANFKIF